MSQHDTFEGIIIRLADGDPARLRSYRTDYTHTEIVTAWKSKLINA